MTKKDIEGKHFIAQKPELSSDKRTFLINEKGALVQLFSVKWIGEGHYSNVYSVNALLQKNKWYYAVKVYKENFSREANEALYIYALLKDSKVAVWHTYRKLKGTNMILMTLWSNKEYALFTPHEQNFSLDKKNINMLLYLQLLI